MSETIAWFAELGDDARDVAGGKAASLARLERAGFPVPPGFAVTAGAFRLALGALDDGSISASVAQLDGADDAACTQLAEHIRARVESSSLDSAVPGAVADAYRELCTRYGPDEPVAVRSSATAEDGSDASFAGMQDSYLWVRGESEVVAAVRRCWASLYNATSLSYRRRIGIPEERMAMGVVVQRMIDARAAGVMFTRSPLSGDRSVIVINASWGLGSSVVGGEVTPDEFVLSKVTLETMRSTVSDKERRHVADRERGGVRDEPVPEDQRRVPSLSDSELRALGALGRSVERHDGYCVDVEWAIDGEDRLFLLQSRPETVWSKKDATPAAAPRASAFEHVTALFDPTRARRA